MFIPEQRIIEYERENPSELTAKQFSRLKEEIKNPKNGEISDELADFILWIKGLPSRQETFAKYVSKFLPRECSILEVGCGRTGRTGRMSRILKEKGYDISCMDPKVDLSYLTEIRTIKERFDFEKTDIKEYDYLIAQEPCEATEHIVRACINNQKGMIMSMCGIAHRLINGKMPSSAQEWYLYLKDIAPDSLKLQYAKLDPLTTTPILKTIF